MPLMVFQKLIKERTLVMKKLVELLSSPEESIVKQVIRVVGNLLARNIDQTHPVIPLFAKLLQHPKISIRKAVVRSLKNITARNRGQVRAVIYANLFPKLLKIISSENDVELKRDVYTVCDNVLNGGTVTEVTYLLGLGIIQVFCDALSSLDLTTVLVVLQGLELILEYTRANDI